MVAFIPWLILSILILVIVFFLFYRFVFLRDPKRAIPEEDAIVSPADGTVMRVEKLDRKNKTLRKGWLGKISLPDARGQLISIFMSPLNVHFTRSPYGGTVKNITYTRGKFFNAGHPEKSFLNENNAIMIDTPLGRMAVIQIAGFLARRIHCFVTLGQKVNKGEKIGLISMGSQTAVVLPAEARVLVKAGARVYGGTSIIAIPAKKS
ncbi:phosphatidylserine decarboxylase family protein [Candidatus Woesearchaeota archaeon]|nr:phosphatidylserine decarboxylase family protein [Candidatus Woesearchaeota archaeon]